MSILPFTLPKQRNKEISFPQVVVTKSFLKISNKIENRYLPQAGPYINPIIVSTKIDFFLR